MRDRATIRRLKMYNTKPTRDKKGRITGGQYMSRDVPDVVRIAPSSSYFENAHTVGQKQLEEFRTEFNKTKNDPYNFVLKQSKVPWSLLSDPEKAARMDLTSAEPFEDTFGKKARRKRPKISHLSYDELLKSAQDKGDDYDPSKDTNIVSEEGQWKLQRDPLFDKGQSKRIWGELYKVIDSSDVVVEVLDARDPMGTRCRHIEDHLSKHRQTKHLIFVLNKCDLVPAWVVKRWIVTLSKEHPTLAMHSSLTNPFGKGSLIQLLRQFAALHKDRKQISVGFIGYPNVGKSSLINTLRSKKVCSVAPVPGETKVWQYITLFKRVFLIDCPGIVYPSGDTETDIVLKGVTRVENLPDPTEHIAAILERVKPEYVQRLYRIHAWDDDEDFLTKLAKRTGKLRKKGEPDLATVAKMVLHDWQRGRLPYFVPPPPAPEGEGEEEEPPAGKKGKNEEAVVKLEDGQVAFSVSQNVEKLRTTDAWDEPHADVSDDEDLQEGADAEATARTEDALAVKQEPEEARGTDKDDDDDDVFDRLMAQVMGEEPAAKKGGALDRDEGEAGAEETTGGAGATNRKTGGKRRSGAERDAADTSREELPIVKERIIRKRKRAQRKWEEVPEAQGRRHVKAPRMTTNKKKVGTHFYDSKKRRKKSRPE